jgi:hypothetical protein
MAACLHACIFLYCWIQHTATLCLTSGPLKNVNEIRKDFETELLLFPTEDDI